MSKMTEERLAFLEHMWGYLLSEALDEIARLTAALDTIANDSDTAYMACSDLPACSGDSFKPETHNKECAVRIAYDALNPEPTS